MALLILQSRYGMAQPIQLIPQNESEVEQGQFSAPFPSSPSLSEFWKGTPPSVIETYFPKLPLILTSPVLQDLRKQIVKEKYSELLQNVAYEKMILSLLIEGGEWEQAKEFLMEAHLPEKEASFLDLYWLAGDSKKACEKINNLIRTSSNMEWKKQNIYCLYLNGEEERAKIAAEILSDLNPAAVQFVNTLFNHSSQVSWDDSIAKSPFLLTVWLESQQDIPEAALNKLSSSCLALIARSQKAPLPTRLLAAEKALQQGTFKSEDFLVLLKEAPQANLWGQFMHELQSPKTETLLPLFDRAAQMKKLGLVGKIFSSLLSSLNPSLEMLPLAPFMIQAFLQGDKPELAKKWGGFLMREVPEEAVAFLPLLHLAFPENKWGESQMQAWQAYEKRTHVQHAVQRSYEMRRILDTLAEPSGQPMKGEPSPPSWRREKALFDEQAATLLESAAVSKRKGEVLLLVLTMVGETPLDEISIDKLALLLKALFKAGFKEEARALALEYLLNKGV